MLLTTSCVHCDIETVPSVAANSAGTVRRCLLCGKIIAAPLVKRSLLGFPVSKAENPPQAGEGSRGECNL